MTMLSIGIFGNTNNSPFAIAEGLRELGHDVTLYVTRADLLHRPESKYSELKGAYPSWIQDCSWLSEDDYIDDTPRLNDAVHLLKEACDLVILNDFGPSLAHRISSPHIALLTGSDLTYYANFDSLIMRSASWDSRFRQSLEAQRYLERAEGWIARQRSGIRTARTVCFPCRGLSPDGDKILDDLKVGDARRLSLHISNTSLLRPHPVPRNPRLTILSGCRIVFRKDRHNSFVDLDFKATDVLLNGFSVYLQRGGLGVLRLVRKGQDLAEAEALIAELKIAHSVQWVDEKAAFEFYKEMVAADLICDQFGEAVPGLVTTDAYALGRPVMANFRNEILLQAYPEPFPGFNARTANDIADTLLMIEASPNLLANMGRYSRKYAETYLSPRVVAERILKHFRQSH